MAEVTLDNRSTAIVASMVAALQGVTVGGVSVFNSARRVNDVESFVRVADPMALSAKPEVAIVEGTVEERGGNDNAQKSVCRLPFEIVVRYAYNRAPAEGESGALDKGREYLELAKAALLLDKWRGGKANLVYVNGEVVPGTSFRGTVRQVVTPSAPNQAFYVAAMSGVCGWFIPN